MKWKKKIYIYICVDFLHDNEMSIVNVEECPTMRIVKNWKEKYETCQKSHNAR